MRNSGKLRIGTSGFHYKHWRGIFYPDGLATSRWFSYYAQRFDTVEINNTFYPLPSAAAFDGWKKQAPPGFLYALKFNRYGSHWMRLKNARSTIGNFFNVAKRLKESLGPILVQLPPRWNADPQRLEDFLTTAPRSLRWAVEFRDPSWLCDEIYRILERHQSALCIHDMIQDHPRVMTAGWTYLRFHGNHYAGTYSPQKLSAEAKWIKQQLARGLDVFAYFNNDAQGVAVENAAELKSYVKSAREKIR
jgi:uncharacterized protein YecE (DUF72 family)